MFIGVLSDVHDQLENLKTALNLFQSRGIITLVFCGDFCSPIPARVIGSFGGQVHCVFGNGDGDRFTISNIAKNDFPGLKLHGESADIELEGTRFAVTHYPFYAQALARTGDYRAVFSGHTHAAHIEYFGETLWLNPGEILGFKGQATCAVYEPVTNEAEIVKL